MYQLWYLLLNSSPAHMNVDLNSRTRKSAEKMEKHCSELQCSLIVGLAVNVGLLCTQGVSD